MNPNELYGAKGPLNIDTFRDTTQAVFEERVANIVLNVEEQLEDAYEAFFADDAAYKPLIKARALSEAYEIAADILATSTVESAIGDDTRFKYGNPDDIRKTAARYLEQYNSLLASSGLLPEDSVVSSFRVGKLRRA